MTPPAFGPPPELRWGGNLNYLFSAQVIPSPTAKRARSTRPSALSLALSARIAFVSASLSARLATDPPHSTLSISTIPPGRTSFRQRSDRKSTRLNSSHDQISYAVFCLKKKINTLRGCLQDAGREGEVRRGQGHQQW